MTEKCRKSLEHKQGAMEEARVKAVLPVPKTTPDCTAAESEQRCSGKLLHDCYGCQPLNYEKTMKEKRKKQFSDFRYNFAPVFEPIHSIHDLAKVI